MLGRFLATLLSFVLLSNVALADAVQGSFWKDRRAAQTARPPQYAALTTGAMGPAAGLLRQIPEVRRTISPPELSVVHKAPEDMPAALRAVLQGIPQSAAQLKDVKVVPGSNALVVLVQDIHLNPEAQENIATVLSSFGPQRLPVGVEGAWGPIDLSAFDTITDGRIRKALAQTYLHLNRLSAPGYVGLTAPKGSVALVGADEPVHYQANVDAYRSAVLHKAAAAAELDKQDRDLQERKARVFTGDLAKFDAVRGEYDKGQMGVGPYVQSLVGLGERHGAMEAADASELRLFLDAYAIEKELDFSKVERERSLVLGDLVGKLSDAELRDMLAQSLAYRSGAISYADFYRFFDGLIRSHGISLSAAPAFSRYVSYVMMSDRISADRLIRSLQSLEDRLSTALATTDEERALLSESEQAALGRKLIDFALTSAEWQRYRAHPRAGLEDFAKFYEEADIRSEHMVAAMSSMVKASAPTNDGLRRSVLVAGGFHTPDLEDKLAAAGISFAVLQPRITKVQGQGTEYLSVFTREKAPLEKIFEGQKLFLAPAAVIPGTAAGTAVTNEIESAGRALESPGQTVASRTPGVSATTSDRPVPGAALAGEVNVEGAGRVRFWAARRAWLNRQLTAARAAFVSRFAAFKVALGIGSISNNLKGSLLADLLRDRALRTELAASVGVANPDLFDAPPVRGPNGWLTNPELLAALRKGRPKLPDGRSAYPPGVDLHLDSHQDLITNLLAESEARPWYRVLLDRLLNRPAFTPERAFLARIFVESHDLGYSINFPAPQKDDAPGDFERRIADFEAQNKADLLEAWTAVGLASGLDEATAAKRAEEAYDVVMAAAAKPGPKQYLVPKTLAHGTTSIALLLRRLAAPQGTSDPNKLDRKKALGIALLFAAHHPGYPITMVDQFLVPGAIPTELLPVFMITGTKPDAEGQLTRGDPDLLRMQVAEYAAGLLGISVAEGRTLATLGYALDRITPARRMQALDLSKVTFDDAGNVTATVPDFWTGGETSKKYPLIVTNIKKLSGLTIFEVYDRTIGNVQQEASAAAKTATVAASGLSIWVSGAINGLRRMVVGKSRREISATKAIQDRAVAWVRGAFPAGQFSGHLENLDADIRLIRAAYEAMGADDPNREAASYLLGTMIAIRTDPRAMGHVAQMQREARFEEAATAIERQISADHLQQPRVTPDGPQTVMDRIRLGIAALSDTKIDNFHTLNERFSKALNDEMRVSLNSLEAKNAKFADMRITRKASIGSAIQAMVTDLNKVAEVFPNNVEKQRQAAILMFVSFQMLLLQDEADLELPYVSHSLQHSHDVRNGVFDVIQVWRSMPGGNAALESKYGPATGYLMLMAAWLHDIGYGTLVPASKALEAKAAEIGIDDFKAGKGYHTRLGLALANTPLSNGKSLMQMMDEFFGLSQRPGLAEGSKTALDDFATMIISHGADKPDVKQDGLPGTGKHALRPASENVDPLNFVVRLADNLDARIGDRLYSFQKNPIFWGFLMKLAARNVPADQVKAEFLANEQAYVQATMLHLETTEGVTNGEALRRAQADFAVTRNNLDSFDYSNYAHFAGMVQNYALGTRDGQLVVTVTLNHDNKTLSEQYKRFQMERMRQSFASLSFGGKPVLVEEAPAPTTGRATVVELMGDERYRDLLAAWGQQASRDTPDVNQENLLRSMIDYFERHGEMDIQTETHAGGELVLTKGSRDKDALILVSGEVTIERPGQDPIKIHAGDFLGEMAIASYNGERNADARVSSPEAKFIRIKEATLRRFFADPLFLVNYADFIGKRRPVPLTPAAEVGEPVAAAGELEAIAADPTAAMTLGEERAEEEQAAPAATSEVRARVQAMLAHRSGNQFKSQRALIQAILDYDREHPAERIFDPSHVVRLADMSTKLIEQGTRGDKVYVVMSGALTATHRNGVVLAAETGPLVGELQMESGEPRSADVTAAIPGTEVVEIPFSVLRAAFSDARVREAFHQLVRSRTEQNAETLRRNAPGTLTAVFTLRFGNALFGLFGIGRSVSDILTRLTVALVIELPLFAAAGLSSRARAWFVDSHFSPDGLPDTPDNRRRIENGIMLVNIVSVIALVLGIAVSLAFGLNGSETTIVSVIAGVAGNVLAHFGINVNEILVQRADARRAAALRDAEAQVTQILRPFAQNQPIDRAALERLVEVLTPKAVGGVGLANAFNARALEATLSQIRANDTLTREDLADILPTVFLLLSTRQAVVDLAEAAANEGAAVRNPEASVRVTAAKTADEIRDQIAAGRSAKNPNDVLVLAVDASVPDAVLASPEFQTGDVRVVRNDATFQISIAGLAALTNLGDRLGRISISVSRRARLSEAVLQQITELQRASPKRVALFLLLDEMTRAVPIGADELSEVVRLQRVIAIQA